ncbi:MAG TPA: transporter substrate-binding domain-containing protein [Pyrinomonadaceae bacterium]|nr:transporter substrate-binding domain-containing protein [Pyrinomonadaceae bacterium]
MRPTCRLLCPLLSVTLLLFPSASCRRGPKTKLEPLDEIVRKTDVPPPREPVKRDLEEIRARGTLTVLAPYNSTTYFVYRGEPLGYEYELLREFASAQGLALKMVVVTDPKSLLPLLNEGEGDIAASRLVPTPETEAQAAFTRALYQTEPALVQQESAPETASKVAEKAMAPGPADPSPEVDIQARLVTRPEQLAGKRVDLPEKSPYERTLVELADEISGDIHVVELGELQDEALAQKVARGEVEFTVMQANLAALKEAEFSNLKVRPVVGRRHEVAWAVRKNSPQLLSELNGWIEDKKNEGLLSRLYKKYFVDMRGHIERATSDYLTSSTGKVCPYDDLLKTHAAEIGWDWRLLASQVYQESRFKPDAKSWAGASGLLQLMPATARQVGVRDPFDPEDNVRGATKYLKWLTGFWDDRIEDEGERLKFILASYNCGAGHVEDAQRLASKYGGNPLAWSDVSYWLLQKSTQQYSSDEVVKFGFCRGLEPVNYVEQILRRYGHYKEFVVASRRAPRPFGAGSNSIAPSSTRP